MALCVQSCVGAIAAAGLLVNCVSAGPDSAARGEFARDVLSGRASVLIIGDSTNNPAGAGLFCPYYEGLLRRLPPSVPVGGFRVSGSTGNIAVGDYVRFLGGSTNVLVGGRIQPRNPLIPVAPGTGYIPPGLRNDLRIVDGMELPDGGRFASLLVWDLGQLSPNAADQWVGADIVLRTPVVVGPAGGGMLGSIGFQTLTDYDDAPGGFVGGDIETVSFASGEWGLRCLDAVFEDVPVLRVGVRLGGDLDNADSEESGSRFAWCHHSLFSVRAATDDHGLYMDSVSVGGFTALDHANTLDRGSLGDYIEAMGRAPTWIMVWLGENVEVDEWDGQNLGPLFSDRVAAIADRALASVADRFPGRDVGVVLVVPPQASGTYPAARYVAFRDALGQLAADRGWSSFDLRGALGDSLTGLDEGFTDDDVHPSLEGSEFVADAWYRLLECTRADMNGDGLRNFFDINDYLNAFVGGDASSDFDGDRAISFFDISAFLAAFSAACP